MKQFNTREVFLRSCEIIKHERCSRALTQIEMALYLGISQSALSKIENQTMSPNLIPWLKFCDKFSLPANLPVDQKRFKNWQRLRERPGERKDKNVSADVAKPLAN